MHTTMTGPLGMLPMAGEKAATNGVALSVSFANDAAGGDAVRDRLTYA